jgi:TPR repeat protein
MGGNSSETQRAMKDDKALECGRLTAPKEIKDGSKPAQIIDWDRAAVICQAALDAHPDEPHIQYGLAAALFHTKHYIEANRYYKLASDAGLPAAQNALGLNYHKGLGTVKDDQKAFELWSKAAAAGWPASMGNLGSAYADGLYVKKDFNKSLEWNEKAIEAGNILSLSVVGNSYLNGYGVDRDFATAAQYFQQGADLGDGFALKTLANMYEAGFMGAPQPDKAGALRLLALQQDPESPDPSPVSVFKQILAAGRAKPVQHVVHRRRYVIFRPYRFCLTIWC